MVQQDLTTSSYKAERSYWTGMPNTIHLLQKEQINLRLAARRVQEIDMRGRLTLKTSLLVLTKVACNWNTKRSFSYTAGHSYNTSSLPIRCLHTALPDPHIDA